MQRRALIIAILFTGMMFVYTCRLVILQIEPSSEVFQIYGNKWKHENWRRAAVSQRRSQLMIDEGRGQFVDDQGRSITGEKYQTVAFFPVANWRKLSSNEINRLSSILHQPPDDMNSFLQQIQYASFYVNEKHLPIKLTDAEVHQLQAMQLKGMEIVQYTNRYPAAIGRSHVIGLLAENPEWTENKYATEIATVASWDRNSKVGVLGLEHSLDRYLHGLGASYISLALDGNAKPIIGIGARLIGPNNPYYPVVVHTTINIEIQSRIEKYLDTKHMNKGAVVLLDAKNGDIKAMISRPQVPAEQVSIQSSELLRNHALTAYEPGSIYKLVTTAAALEYGVTTEDEIFHCNGEYGKYGLSCWNKTGHGAQNLEQAFANSCNIVFATLAERLTPEQMTHTASALGVTHKVGWHLDQSEAPIVAPFRLLEEEENGKLFYDLNNIDGGIMAQTGIGQRDVRLSPLQAANMIVTLLNGGKQYENRVVSSLTYYDGQLLADLPVHQSHENKYAIHEKTARTVLGYMQEVVQQGTGKRIRDGIWSIAGKSGTAQLSGKLQGYNQHWFIGYAPVEDPKYALAVLVEQQPANTSNQATKMFRDIMDIVADTID